MLRFSLGILIFLMLGFFPQSAQGQTFSAGVVAGVSLTSGFPNETIVIPGPTALHTSYSSRAGNYLVGGLFEIRLPWNLAVEADGIYRPLNFKASTSSVAQSASLNNTVLSWEFPMVLKRRFPIAAFSGLRLAPLVEVGPSFRASGNRNDTALSTYGVTAGAGVEMRAGRARLAPTLRYTRWASDSVARPGIPRSTRNQAEFLVGFSF